MKRVYSIMNFKTFENVKNELSIRPDQFTAWFKIAFPKVEEYLKGIDLGFTGY